MKHPTRFGAILSLPHSMLRGYGLLLKMVFGCIFGFEKYSEVKSWAGKCLYFSKASLQGYLRTAFLGVDGNGKKVSWF